MTRMHVAILVACMGPIAPLLRLFGSTALQFNRLSLYSLVSVEVAHGYGKPLSIEFVEKARTTNAEKARPAGLLGLTAADRIANLRMFHFLPPRLVTSQAGTVSPHVKIGFTANESFCTKKLGQLHLVTYYWGHLKLQSM